MPATRKFENEDARLRFEWNVLDCMETYANAEMVLARLEDESDGVTLDEVIQLLEHFVLNHEIHLANGERFDREGISHQANGGPAIYWFGRTESGFLKWLHGAEEWQRAIALRGLLPGK